MDTSVVVWRRYWRWSRQNSANLIKKTRYSDLSLFEFLMEMDFYCYYGMSWLRSPMSMFPNGNDLSLCSLVKSFKKLLNIMAIVFKQVYWSSESVTRMRFRILRWLLGKVGEMNGFLLPVQPKFYIRTSNFEKYLEPLKNPGNIRSSLVERLSMLTSRVETEDELVMYSWEKGSRFWYLLISHEVHDFGYSKRLRLGVYV